jgi:hypothetical protein
MLEACSQIDAKLVSLSVAPEALRASEAIPHVEGMNQEVSEAIFYSDTRSHPHKILGLDARYDSLANEFVIDAGGTGNNCASIWLVIWGDHTAFMTFPKGSKAGLEKRMGKEIERLTDEEGGRYDGYEDVYKWDLGMVVKDHRFIVRIANIDVTKLNEKPEAADGSQNANFIDLADLMIQASEMPPNTSMGKPAWYMNKKIRTAIRRQCRWTKNVNWSQDNYEGKVVSKFDEIPVRRVDSLLLTEEALT